MGLDVSCFPLSLLLESTQQSSSSTILPDELLQTCEQLANRCMDRSSRRGSLYCGGLGPHVYLPFRLAQEKLLRQKKNGGGNSSSTTHAETRVVQQLLQHAQEAAQYALSHNTREDERRVTLLESHRIGAMCLLVAIEKKVMHPPNPPHHQPWQVVSANRIVDELSNKCQRLAPEECEVLYGRAGALAAVFFLRMELELPELGNAFVVATAVDILRQGLKEAKDIEKTDIVLVGRLPLLWRWHGTYYLGAAHGVVGILHTLMNLRREEWDQVCVELPQIRSRVMDTVASLASLCHSSGNLTSSLSEQSAAERKDRLVHWCHGAPGHCLLLIKASQVFKEPTFLRAAENIAETVIWPRGLLRKGVGLCHGISGNGYTLLCLATATRNLGLEESSSKWTTRAMQYARFAMDQLKELESIPDFPYSLYEGASGLCAFLLDCTSSLEDTSTSNSKNSRVPRFPLYDF
jgi:hypothetical protein